ncbi:MAG: hypothetical protein QXW94_01145, partial [Desulfurococcaceae archaeon]
MINGRTAAELSKEANEISQLFFKTSESIKVLKEKRLALISDIRKLREEKLKLLQDIRSIKGELGKLVEARRKLITELKEVLNRRKTKIEEIKSLRELMNTKTIEWQSVKQEVKIPISVLKQKVEEIEWTIQTNILTQERENELIKKLRAYNALLDKLHKAKKSREEAQELRALYISLKMEVGSLTEKASK